MLCEAPRLISSSSGIVQLASLVKKMGGPCISIHMLFRTVRAGAADIVFVLSVHNPIARIYLWCGCCGCAGSPEAASDGPGQGGKALRQPQEGVNGQSKEPSAPITHNVQ